MKLRHTLPPLALALLFGHILSACTGMSDVRSGPTTGPFAQDVPDVGQTLMPCGVTANCPHNQLCFTAGGSMAGQCVEPRNMGRCVPAGPAGSDPDNCYPGARCIEVPRTMSTLGGMCTFGNAPAAAFRVSSVEKIALISPTPFEEVGVRESLALKWQPPQRQDVDSIAVTAVLRRPPAIAPDSNRLVNASDIVWIWSSTAPGGAAIGDVPLRSGYASLRADGSLGAPFGRDSLDPGRYWWLTFTIRNGRVEATSDAFSFRVGDDFGPVGCASDAQCAALIPGETADRVLCFEGRCKRRCASAIDCPGLNRRCALETRVDGDGGVSPPRGAFCTDR